MSRLALCAFALATAAGPIACEPPDAPSPVVPSEALATSLPPRLGATEKQPSSAGASEPTPSYGPKSPMTPGTDVDGDLVALDDGQLAGIVHGIHEAETELAAIGRARAVSPDVRRFVDEVSEAHGAADNQLRAILDLVEIVPTGSSRSATLRAQTSADVAMLQQIGGRAFDSRFIDEQVALHRMADDLLDAVVLKTTNKMLKAQIKADLAVIDDRLLQAQKLQKQLHGSGP
jgi:putative membrane protein